jgi:hypothetical protein
MLNDKVEKNLIKKIFKLIRINLSNSQIKIEDR